MTILNPKHLDIRPNDPVAVRSGKEWLMAVFVKALSEGAVVVDSEGSRAIDWDLIGPPF